MLTNVTRWILVVMVLGFASPAKALDPWSAQDVVLETGFAALVAVDVAQTKWFLHHTAYVETNPLLGAHPSTPKLYFGALSSVVLHAGVTALLPARLRPYWQTFYVGIEVAAISNNVGLVGGFHLSF